MSSTHTPLHPSSLEGQILCEHYRVEALVGEGGMAWVYRAIHEETKEVVAIKVLRDHRRKSKRGEARFLREAETQAQLTHPNIVQVYKVFEAGAVIGFVQEWCEGGDLHQYLQKHRGPLSITRIRQLFLPLLDAVGYAHSEGLIHRDIKPANVLLHGEEGGEVKLNDFGLVKVTDLDSLTSTGTVMGTVHYMAPEQFVETKDVDLRADLYSLGVLLYELTTGRVPFTGRMPALGMKILKSPPPPPREAPYAFHEILGRALAKKPDERYQDCESMKAAVVAALAGTDTAPSPVPVPVSGPAAFAITAPSPVYGGTEASGPVAALPEVVTSDEHLAVSTTDGMEVPVTPAVTPAATTDAMRNAYTPQSGPIERPAFSSSDFGPKPAARGFSMRWVGLLLVLGFGIGVVGALRLQSTNQRERADAGARRTLARRAPIRRAPIRRAPVRRAPVRRGQERRSLSTRPQARALRAKAPAVPDVRVQAPVRPPAPRVLGVPHLAQPVRRESLPTARPARRPSPRVDVWAAYASAPPRVAARPRPRAAVIARAAPVRPTPLNFVSPGPATGADLFRTALTHEHKRNYVAARKSLAASCKHRYVDACARLAWLYSLGKGGPKDAKLGISMFTKSCEMGHRQSCYYMGRVFQESKLGQKLDRAKARRWHQKACRLKYALACLRLAVMMFKGRGGKRDLKGSRAILLPYCNVKKDGRACRNLAYMYNHVLKVPNHYKIARKFAAKGCAYNEPNSCASFGFSQRIGRGGPKDLRASYRSFVKGCKLKHGACCFFAASSLMRGEGVRINGTKARKMARLSCKYKDEDGCHILGRMYSQSIGGKQDCKKANAYYRMACKMGEKTACREFCRVTRPRPRPRPQRGFEEHH